MMSTVSCAVCGRKERTLHGRGQAPRITACERFDLRLENEGRCDERTEDERTEEGSAGGRYQRTGRVENRSKQLRSFLVGRTRSTPGELPAPPRGSELP